MKKFWFSLAMFTAAVASAGIYGVGLNPDGFGQPTKCSGALVVSTNASQTASVKAIYRFPQYGTINKYDVRVVRVQQADMRVETLTNWCNNVTENYVVVGDVTNYYSSVTVSTNAFPIWVDVPVTNTWPVRVVTGFVDVTNELYSITASGGVGSSTDVKLIGKGAALLVTGAPVELFTE